mmetsp:Transcript_114396/g.198950  ORF Transcript_114396/g.198950 Transcript_114396/m.198950 type:complete len:359 (+) Transcript_114396:1687-2763(+)
MTHKLRTSPLNAHGSCPPVPPRPLPAPIVGPGGHQNRVSGPRGGSEAMPGCTCPYSDARVKAPVLMLKDLLGEGRRADAELGAGLGDDVLGRNRGCQEHTSPHGGPLAHNDAPHQCRPSVDSHVILKVGVPPLSIHGVLAPLLQPREGHIVEQLHIVPYHGRLPNDDPSRMVHEHGAPNASSWVNFDCGAVEGIGTHHAGDQRHLQPVQFMSHAVHTECQQSWVAEDDLFPTAGGRVPSLECVDVLHHEAPEMGQGIQELLRDVPGLRLAPLHGVRGPVPPLRQQGAGHLVLHQLLNLCDQHPHVVLEVVGPDKAVLKEAWQDDLGHSIDDVLRDLLAGNTKHVQLGRGAALVMDVGM